MTQSSINLSNVNGAVFRNALNEAFESIATSFAGEEAPSVTYPNQIWFNTADINNIIWNIRNNTNADWIQLANIKNNKIYFTGMQVDAIKENIAFPVNYDTVYRDRDTGEFFVKI
jgi:hypothetical protein